MRLKITYSFIFLLFIISLTNSSDNILRVKGEIVIDDINDGALQISENTVDDNYPTIISDNTSYWIFWGNISGTTGEIWGRIYFVENNSLNEPFRLTDNPGDDWNPSGYIDSTGTIWVFFQSNRAGNYDIWYKNSSNNGFSWSQAFQLTNDPLNELSPRATLDNEDNAWIFYNKQSIGDTEVVYKRKLETEIIWGSETIITLSDVSIREEITDVYYSREQNSIYLFVQEVRSSYAVFLWKLDLATNDWLRIEVTPPNNNGGGSLFIILDIQYVIYQEKTNKILYFVESKNGGNSFSSAIQISQPNFQNQNPKAFVISNETVMIVWSSIIDGDMEIYLNTFEITLPPEVNPNEDLISKYGGPALLIGSLGAVLFGTMKSLPGINDRRHNEGKIPGDINFTSKISMGTVAIIGATLLRSKIRRMDANNVTDNSKRELILHLLVETDFMHLRQLKRKVGSGMALLAWHLLVLEDFGLVKKAQYKQYVVYYLTENKPDPKYIQIYFHMLSKTALSIVRTFLEFDELKIAFISYRLKISVKTIRYHCNKFLKDKLFVKLKTGELSINPNFLKWFKKAVEKRLADLIS